MSEEIRSGFSSTSILAILYAILVFTPTLIYLQLMVGSASVPVAWFTLVLWTEIARVIGRRVTKQEATIIYLLAAAELYIPVDLVFRVYYVHSDIARLFGLTQLFPNYFAPLEKEIFESRTLLHTAWIPSMSLIFLALALGTMVSISLGLMARELYLRVERLPFPLQQIDAKGIEILSTGKRESLRLLFLLSSIGFIYGFVLYALPFVLQAWTGRAIQFIPIPWIDLNAMVEKTFPGACFGVATDLFPIAMAFVYAPSTSVSLIIGSLAIYFFGNWLTVAYNLAPVAWWVPGMGLNLGLQRSILYFWAAPIVGIQLAAGLLPLFRHPQIIKKAFTHLFQPKVAEESRGSYETFSPLKVIVLPYIITSLVGIGMYVVYAPQFPLWVIVLLVFGLPLLTTIVGGRMVGETGLGVGETVTVNLTRLSYFYVASTGYQGIEMWMLPNIAYRGSGEGRLAQFKVAELTNTSIRSLLVALLVLLPLGVLMGVFFMQLYWSIAPMPSSRYPATEIFWPIQASMYSLWIRGQFYGLFNPSWMLYAFLGATGVYLVTLIPRVPLSLVPLAAGAAFYPPFAMTLLIGVVIATILRRRTGNEWWNENKQILSAGLMLGEGVAAAIGVGVTLVINSIWVMPY